MWNRRRCGAIVCVGVYITVVSHMSVVRRHYQNVIFWGTRKKTEPNICSTLGWLYWIVSATHFPLTVALWLIYPVQFNIPLMCMTLSRSENCVCPKWKFIICFYSDFESNHTVEEVMHGKVVVNRYNTTLYAFTHSFQTSVVNRPSTQRTTPALILPENGSGSFGDKSTFTIITSSSSAQSKAKLQFVPSNMGFSSANQRLIYGLFA